MTDVVEKAPANRRIPTIAGREVNVASLGVANADTSAMWLVNAGCDAFKRGGGFLKTITGASVMNAF
jgi:hypothetical protein